MRGGPPRCQAIAVIQQQLAVVPTPELECLLGDLCDDADAYRSAWTRSHGRYPRALRALGALHIRRREVSEPAVLVLCPHRSRTRGGCTGSSTWRRWQC